jgi:hypothetical protein
MMPSPRSHELLGVDIRHCGVKLDAQRSLVIVAEAPGFARRLDNSGHWQRHRHYRQRSPRPTRLLGRRARLFGVLLRRLGLRLYRRLFKDRLIGRFFRFFLWLGFGLYPILARAAPISNRFRGVSSKVSRLSLNRLWLWFFLRLRLDEFLWR